MLNTATPQLLDVTIRDGGYANNYDFSIEQVVSITQDLEKSGISMIEIGHGYGLGAERLFGNMKETDETYISSMSGVLKKAKFGMFANSNITTSEDIKRAASQGLDFVRIGFIGFDGPHPFNRAIELLDVAKDAGLWASINMVRTLFLSECELQYVAQTIDKHFADALYIVDSTGGFLPQQVENCTKLLKKSTDISIGYHGHQNLDLGVANTLIAYENGAEYLDGTLGGIGRDTGNVQLEVLCAVLTKAGYLKDIDPFILNEITQNYIYKSFNKVVGITNDNLILGMYDLLSHVVPKVKKLTKGENISYKKVIELLGKQKNNFEDDDVLRNAINSIKEAK